MADSYNGVTMARQHSDYAYNPHHPTQQPHLHVVQPRQYGSFSGPSGSQYRDDVGSSRHPYAYHSPLTDSSPSLTYRSTPSPSHLAQGPSHPHHDRQQQPSPLEPPAQGSANAARPTNLQIVLPAGQTNTLAAKTTGNATLFQKAKAILHHLRTINGFDAYLSYQPDPVLGFESDHPTAVEHVWWCLRIGASLVFLVNLVGATGVWDRYATATNPSGRQFEPVKGAEPTWPEGEALNWMVGKMSQTGTQNACKRPLFQAFSRLIELQKAGGWPNETDTFSITEVYGQDTNALVKIFNIVITLLGFLPPPPPPMMNGRPSISGHPGFDPLSPISQYPMPPGVHSFAFPPSSSAASSPYNPHDSGSSTNSYGQPPHGAFTPNGFMTGIHALPGAVTPGGAALMGFGGGALGGSQGAVGEAANLVKELLETEKKYIQELELLLEFSKKLIELNVVSVNVAHNIFSNLHLLLDFQRKFQTSLEIEADKMEESNWRMGDWGKPFIKHEKEFEVYEPYCANYADALSVVSENLNIFEQPDLCLDFTGRHELDAFLIKPIQRITKYPLLLSSLVKATNDSDYASYKSLTSGLLSVKRITDRVNETSRAKENAATKKELGNRVTDWKGHDPEQFGDLLLDDQLVATKSGSDRDYHVFLFEKMLLCCKDANDKSNRKSSRSNQGHPRPATGGGGGFGRGERRQLSVKGRIYINNLTHTEIERRKEGGLGLQLYWRSQESPETSSSFLLHMRTEEQLLKWDTTVNKLIDYEQRLINDKAKVRRTPPGYRRPSLGGQGSGSYAGHGGSDFGIYSGFSPPTPMANVPPLPRNMSIASAASSSHSDFSYGTSPTTTIGFPPQGRPRTLSSSNLRNGMPFDSPPVPPLPVNPRQGSIPIVRQESADSASNSASSSIGPGPPLPVAGPSCMLRIHYENAQHTVKVPRNFLVPDLRERVHKKLCRGHPELEGSVFKLTYQDDDDDWVTLSDKFPNEFREHLEYMEEGVQVELRVSRLHH